MRRATPTELPGRHISISCRSLMLLLALVANIAIAQSGKPTVPVSDYGKWERLPDFEISPDGRLIAYEIHRVDEQLDVRLRGAGLPNGQASEEQGNEFDLTWATDPTFSSDSSWLAVKKVVPKETRKQLEKKKEPVPTGVILFDTAQGEQRDFDNVVRHAFDSTGRFLALLAAASTGSTREGNPKEKQEAQGADLLVIDLIAGREDSAATETEMAFGNVTEFAWSEKGSELAMVIETADPSGRGNGVQLYSADSGRLRSLASAKASKAHFSNLTWREDEADLVFLRSVVELTTQAEGGQADGGEDDSSDGQESEAAGTGTSEVASSGREETEEPTYDLHAFSQLAEGPNQGRRWVLNKETAAIPERYEIAEHQDLVWSRDGTKISFGLVESEGEEQEKEQENEEGEETTTTEAGDVDDEEGQKNGTEKDGAEEEDLPGLQIWHTKDVRLYPEQATSKEADSKRSLLSVWHLDSERVIRLGSKLLQETELAVGFDYAVEHDTEPYPWGNMFGRPYQDLWVIDGQTGQRRKALEKVRSPRLSTGGKYVTYFDGSFHWSLELATGELRNLTADLPATFSNQEYDTPTDQLPSYGVGGWLENDEAVLLNDRFDVWRVAPNGSVGTRLTEGAADRLVHRVINFERRSFRDPEEPLPADSPLYFSLRNEDTEQRGLARYSGKGTAERLIYEDALLSQFAKAEDTDVYAFVKEAHDDSPDLFRTDTDFRTTTQVSKTNPFQADFAWSKSQLIDFESEGGRDLQAALFYPANHDPSKRYPMIVYTYEILAPQIHRYHVPDERRYYNVAAWTQNGYFVLYPDIVYRAREPGQSAIEAVRAAVETVIEKGLVDRERVGLIGHSWGGYQAAYLPTRIDTFAASVAGAPLTDFVSFMGQLHWGPGIAELSHWETGQARMEVPFWEDPEAHRRNSPIHKLHELETPLLMAFGNEDGVVDWDQGTEFYNFARRAGKQMVLLVYEGEDHGFRQEANQIDYHRRILEWFGHYLKGEPSQPWMTEGIAIDKLEDEKRRVAESAAAQPPPD